MSTDPDLPPAKRPVGRPPTPTAQPLTWRRVKRPVFSNSSLPVDLLEAIRKTVNSGRSIELSFSGDEIGLRRIKQRLAALAKRKFFGEYPLRTAHRGGHLYVWLQRLEPVKRGKRLSPDKAAQPGPHDTVPCDGEHV
jgi:hypothetical protein